MVQSDFISGLVFVAVAVGAAALSWDFPSIAGQNFGPNVMPRVVAGLMATGGIALCLRSRGNQGQPVTRKRAPFDRGFALFLGLIVAGLLIYAFLLDWIGFVPLTLVFTTLVVRLSGGSMIGSVVFAVLCTLVVNWSFGTLLHVPLPPGLMALLG